MSPRIATGLSALLFLFLAVPSLDAQTVTLTPDTVLRLHFTAGPFLSAVPPDVLSMALGLVQVHQPFTTRTARLFDCGQLLGVANSSSFGGYSGPLGLSPSNSFRTSTSLFTFDSPGIADFTTLVNGTIQGRIEFTIATGSMSFPLSQVGLSLLRATSGSGGTVVSPAPVITEVDLVPRLELAPGVIPGPNSLVVRGTTPGSLVFFAVDTNCGTFPLCPGVTLDLPMFLLLGYVPSDAAGTATFPLGTIPCVAPGFTVYLQALELPACKPTNVVTVVFPC